MEVYRDQIRVLELLKRRYTPLVARDVKRLILGHFRASFPKQLILLAAASYGDLTTVQRCLLITPEAWQGAIRHNQVEVVGYFLSRYDEAYFMENRWCFWGFFHAYFHNQPAMMELFCKTYSRIAVLHLILLELKRRTTIPQYDDDIEYRGKRLDWGPTNPPRFRGKASVVILQVLKYMFEHFPDPLNNGNWILLKNSLISLPSTNIPIVVDNIVNRLCIETPIGKFSRCSEY